MGPQFVPITFHNMPQIVVFFPIFSYFVVNIAGHFIPYPYRVAIISLRRVRGLPNIPLLPGWIYRPIPILGGSPAAGWIEYRPDNFDGGNLQLFMRGIIVVRIVIFINIGKAIRPKIDGIGTSCKAAIVFFRIFHLNGQSFPTACGSPHKGNVTILHPYLGIVFNFRNQFVGNGITIWSLTCGIYSIRIIVIG